MNLSDLETQVAGHYTTGSLLARIAQGLAKTGKELTSATAKDLKPVDEFHIGGLGATEALLAQVPITEHSRVVDLGSGIGGTARYIAERYGADVTGIDLTAEFVETAQKLSVAVGIAATFKTGSVLDIPEPDNSFDVATLIHVGMNIPDKQRLFTEVARVLKNGGSFAVYDVMLTGDGAVSYPVPWATTVDQSHVGHPQGYRDAAKNAGFALIAERDRGDFAREFFVKLGATIANSGQSPLGIPLIVGEHAVEKIANMVTSVNSKTIAPVEMIFRLG